MFTILFEKYKKKISFFLLFGSIFIFVGIYGFFRKEKDLCEVFILFEENVLCVEIADTEEKKSQGLSFRKGLEKNTGMLFVFDEETFPQMWMKDMNFALDFIWMNSEGVVVDIDENVAPDTYPKIIDAPVATPFVLEVPAGFVRDHGIEKNMKMILLEKR
ncbi:MAG: DUF192 domain-containing protein [Candidatus Moranbacteria bacterium]|nr:DUF192 domain-containing protein [Candidatus Moranbacteria bacterium]